MTRLELSEAGFSVVLKMQTAALVLYIWLQKANFHSVGAKIE